MPEESTPAPVEAPVLTMRNPGIYDAMPQPLDPATPIQGVGQPLPNVVLYIQNSIREHRGHWVFAVNDWRLWSAARHTIEQFLTNLWEAGHLKGASAEDAFRVSCALGETMTPEDILDGKFNVVVELTKPVGWDEPRILTVQTQMQRS